MNHWWKGFLVGLASLAVVAGARPAAAASCGDLNNSGTVTTADAVLLLQAVSGIHPSPATLCGGLGAQQCGDLNASGGLTVGDLVVLLNVVAGNPTLFPPCSGALPPLACGSTLSGNVTGNVRVRKCGGCEADCSAFVDGLTFVQGGVTLTIDPGATVCGRRVSSNGTPSALIFLRDAKINAPGLPCEPIVFTSDAPEGSKVAGDWAGLVFNGRAPVNCSGGECLSEGLASVSFGGSNPNDSSGLMRFVRVEFAGFELSPDNELNVITLNGVGRGSDFTRFQANLGTDDGIEWFGGTVRSKYIVSSGASDDQFDWQIGYVGANQFGLALQRNVAMSGSGRHGYEADNNENGENNTPRSNPTFCNVTLVGAKAQGDTNTGRFGAELRRGTAGTLANNIIMDFAGAGVRLPDANTATQACATGALRIQDTLFFNNGPAPGDLVATGSGNGSTCTGDIWYDTILSGLGNLPASSPALGPNPGITTGAYPTTVTNQFIPTNVVDTAAPDCRPLQPDFFDSAAYKGAFVPGGTSADNWLISCPSPGPGQCNWISFDAD
jgi:hypothetical protein